MKLRTKNLTVEISFPLAAAITAVLIIDRSLSSAICLISVVIHESGHLFALYKCKAFPKKITLTLFDIAISDARKPLRNIKDELTVVMSGITANLTAVIICIGLKMEFDNEYLDYFLYSNMTLAVFNGLPVYTLDGGQALNIILCRITTFHRAEIILNTISFIVLVPMFIAGILVLFESKYNFSLLLISIYLAVLIISDRKKG